MPVEQNERQAFLDSLKENNYTLFGDVDELEIPAPDDASMPSAMSSAPAFTTAQVEGPSHEVETIRHGTPDVPIEVDGNEIDPTEISQYDGQPLYSTVQSTGEQGRSKLVSFTNPVRAAEFVQNTAEGPDDIGPGLFASHISPSCTASFYSSTFFRGKEMELDYRHVAWDLREWRLRGFLWWTRESWDNEISSLITTCRGVTLYALPGWRGSQLHFRPRSVVLSLGHFGWNNRASSIKTTYR
ncbi:MAG: hypothetical protein R3300_13090 [Candidatus Promineifilaceae bacterium]|nr:hypothetical protein [Candidatus Promineifilaceae bacterium]